jgi:hypothetical protein
MAYVGSALLIAARNHLEEDTRQLLAMVARAADEEGGEP